MTQIKKGGKPPVYNSSLKITVAREYLSGHLGYGKLALKYDLPGAVTVRYFVKWYKATYPEGEVTNAAATAAAPDPAIENELASLRKQLQMAQLKATGLEIMMEVAKKELGIDIPKKFGTKQSSK